MKLRPQKQIVGKKDLTKATRIRWANLRHAPKPRFKVTPIMTKLGGMPMSTGGMRPMSRPLSQSPYTAGKPWMVTAKPKIVTPRTAPRPIKSIKLFTKPRPIRFKMTALTTLPADVVYGQAKQQLHQIKRTAKKYRKFDRIAHAAVNELIRREQLDMRERMRQAREAAFEQRRYLREEIAAARRAERMRKTLLKNPEL